MNQRIPLISIIIPTYNRANLIGETLDSVIAQTYSNWECIVVDDGSTDNTEAIVRSYEKKDIRIKFFKRPFFHKSGGTGSRNYGLNMSKGEYIYWFDDDDLMLENHIERCVSEIQLESSVVVVVRNMHFGLTKKKQGTSKVNFPKSFSVLTAKYITTQIRLGTPGLFFKRSQLEGFTWNENLTSKQDVDFIGRLLISFMQKPIKFSVLDVPTVLIRKHDSSISIRNNNDSLVNEFIVRMSLYTSYISVCKMEFQDQIILAKRFKDIITSLWSSGTYNLIKLVLAFNPLCVSKIKSFLFLVFIGGTWKFRRKEIAK